MNGVSMSSEKLQNVRQNGGTLAHAVFMVDREREGVDLKYRALPRSRLRCIGF